MQLFEKFLVNHKFLAFFVFNMNIRIYKFTPHKVRYQITTCICKISINHRLVKFINPHIYEIFVHICKISANSLAFFYQKSVISILSIILDFEIHSKIFK